MYSVTISSLVEALMAHSGRFRSLENVRLLSREAAAAAGRQATQYVDFEVSIGGVDCDLRCPLGDSATDYAAQITAGWRLVEEELLVFDAQGQARVIDVLVRPSRDGAAAARRPAPAHADFEEYVWDPVWGLATVMEEGRWWLLDGEGRVLNPEPFDWLGEISEGVMVAQRGRNFGYIDTSGREVVPLVYSDANSFSGGRALVERDGKSFYIASPLAARIESEKEYSI